MSEKKESHLPCFFGMICHRVRKSASPTVTVGGILADVAYRQILLARHMSAMRIYTCSLVCIRVVVI